MERKYRPSNGTEGMLFMGRFCDRCEHEPDCEIILMTMCHNVDDPEYPEEWIYNSEGKATCTKFSRMDE